MPVKAKNSFASILSDAEPKKHSVRYNAAQEETDAVCTSIYVNRSVIESLGNPDSIKVTIEPA